MKKRINRRKVIFWTPIWLIVLSPLISFLFWYTSEKQKVKIVLFDKTVYDEKVVEHDAFFWLLTNNNFVNSEGEYYDPREDYFGFFPIGRDSFQLKTIEDYSKFEVDSLASSLDLLVFSDSYGVYSNEWESKKNINERSELIYGRTTLKEVELLKSAKQQEKHILAEFNLLASPTRGYERREIERIFDFKWSGWVGRYYDNLDTNINSDLPMWLKENYTKQHNNSWPFSKEGIVLVNENDRIEILSNALDLKNENIIIKTAKQFQTAYQLPDTIKYNFWFDIIGDIGTNELVSEYQLETTTRGDSILASCKIPNNFPAVFRSSDHKFHYLAGDFSDHDLHDYTRYFKKIEWVKGLFIDRSDKSARQDFFWEYYRPLIKNILDGITANNRESDL